MYSEREWTTVGRALTTLGYLVLPVGGEMAMEAADRDERLSQAIRTFQSTYEQTLGLDVTGILDRPTANALQQPMCGNSDPVPRGRRFQAAEARELLRKAIERGRPLRYFLQPRDDAATVDARRFRHVRRAFTTWSALGFRAGIGFVEELNPNNADILVRWTPSANSVLGLSGNIIAHADFPTSQRKPLLLELDEDHRWVTGGSGGFDIQSVALHEIGHLLGLEHHPDPDAVMYFTFNGVKRRLEPEDELAFNHLHP
jgi:hypothetical protein